MRHYLSLLMNQKLSVLRFPIFWLYLGPPAFRVQSTRGAMASVRGSFDFWNFLQVAWWTAFGVVAVLELYRKRRQMMGFLHWMGSIKWWILLWILPMYVSCLISPSLKLSLGNVGMLTILVIAALDLGVKIYDGTLTPHEVVKGLLFMAVGLLLVIGIAAVGAPGMVLQDSGAGTGLRIRGGQIAYSPLLASTVLLISFYFWGVGDGRRQWALAIAMMGGLLFLFLGQTRAEYGAFVVGAGLFGWQWGRLSRRGVRLLTAGATIVALACTGLLLGSTSDAVVSAYAEISEKIMRGGEYVYTLNGRTRVWRLIWEVCQDKLWGLGYLAGPRTLLMRPDSIEFLYTGSWGNAHNAYIEVFSGSGYLAAGGFLAIVGYIGWCILFGWRQIVRRCGAAWWALVPLHALIVVTLIGGITESYLVLPFWQQSVTFWIAAAVVIAGRARLRQGRRKASRFSYVAQGA